MGQRGTLALVGGGEFQAECAAFDSQLLELAPGKEVFILPTAAAYENPSKKIDRGMTYFQSLGADCKALEILTRRDALDPQKASPIESAGIIYITDGSPMHLRSTLMNSETISSLKKAWLNGTVLVGAGAGGNILCDYMVDARGGAFTVGLGILTELSMISRYETWSEEKIKRTIELAPSEIFVVGVPSQTALISEPKSPWRQAGKAEVCVFRNSERLNLEDMAPLQ